MCVSEVEMKMMINENADLEKDMLLVAQMTGDGGMEWRGGQGDTTPHSGK